MFRLYQLDAVTKPVLETSFNFYAAPRLVPEAVCWGIISQENARKFRKAGKWNLAATFHR